MAKSFFSTISGTSFTLSRRLSFSIVVSFLCIGAGIFPITDKFEAYVFEPPVLNIDSYSCGAPQSYKFFLKDSKIILRLIFDQRGEQVDAPPGIVETSGIKLPSEEASKHSYCNEILVSLELEGEDAEFRPIQATIRRDDLGLEEQELLSISRGASWKLNELISYLGEDTFSYQLSDFLYDPQYSLKTGSDDRDCKREQYQWNFSSSVLRINGENFCVLRSEIPQLGEEEDALREVFRELLPAIDPSNDPTAELRSQKLTDYRNFDDTQLSKIVEERLSRLKLSETGIELVDIEFTCKSCVSPITKSVQFSIKNGMRSNLFDDVTNISILSDYSYEPSYVDRIPDEARSLDGEKSSSGFENDRFEVGYDHKDGFFNLDFFQIISSILIGVGITILIEIAIGSKIIRSRQDKQTRSIRVDSRKRKFRHLINKTKRK
ncbi:hypothetical protein A8B75_18590 [Sphingomonadales bacterium EhC05]|nr:hypothetical protein A8B75_18590 [Sphingomonadales bacterium EhC05]